MSRSHQLADNRAQVDTLTQEERAVILAKKQLNQYAELLKITKAVVPQDKDQAETVRQLTSIAAANGVTLNTISFPSSTLGSSAPTGSSSAATAAANSKNALSQLTPVKGMAGVYSMQITIANNADNAIDFNQLVSFLAGLESNRRTAQVSSLTIQPQPDHPGKLVFTLVLNTYVKP